MGKYFECDYVETTKGIGQIERVWKLNDKITVFEVWLLKDKKKVNMFYGEIIKEINDEFYNVEG